MLLPGLPILRRLLPTSTIQEDSRRAGKGPVGHFFLGVWGGLKRFESWITFPEPPDFFSGFLEHHLFF